MNHRLLLNHINCCEVAVVLFKKMASLYLSAVKYFQYTLSNSFYVTKHVSSCPTMVWEVLSK